MCTNIRDQRVFLFKSNHSISGIKIAEIRYFNFLPSNTDAAEVILSEHKSTYLAYIWPLAGHRPPIYFIGDSHIQEIFFIVSQITILRINKFINASTGSWTQARVYWIKRKRQDVELSQLYYIRIIYQNWFLRVGVTRKHKYSLKT